MAHGGDKGGSVDRRQTLALLGAIATGAACSDDSADPGTGGSNAGGSDNPGGSPSVGGGGVGGAGVGGDGTGGAGGEPSTGGWASGGTGSMSGDYPDPFTDPLGSSCTLSCGLTLGPCYGETIDRKDISEGYPGLPVRLALLVVDADCQPVVGATVDIWHTGHTGLYSGDDVVAMCTGGDADAEAHRYFRGVQTTDADGRVDFDTCYPGWYPGRAIHIHFTIRQGNREATSQLFFPDALNEEICGTHPDYTNEIPDTSNATDGIFDASLIVESAQQADGALMAWKVLVLGSAAAAPNCD
jgi:protocatechuate 3,4-dioxygenase beta subunit